MYRRKARLDEIPHVRPIRGGDHREDGRRAQGEGVPGVGGSRGLLEDGRTDDGGPEEARPVRGDETVERSCSVLGGELAQREDPGRSSGGFTVLVLRRDEQGLEEGPADVRGVREPSRSNVRRKRLGRGMRKESERFRVLRSASRPPTACRARNRAARRSSRRGRTVPQGSWDPSPCAGGFTSGRAPRRPRDRIPWAMLQTSITPSSRMRSKCRSLETRVARS